MLDHLGDIPVEVPTDPAPRPRRARRLLLVLVTTLVTLGVIAGTVVAVQHHQVNQRRAAAAAAEKREAAQLEKDVEECHDVLGDYVDSLSEIDARLDVGVTASNLGELAGDASVEESRVDSGDLRDLPDFCQDAKDEADVALDAYAWTASEWDDCIWDDWCDPEDLDLQSSWADATDAIESAELSMDGEAVAFDDEDSDSI